MGAWTRWALLPRPGAERDLPGGQRETPTTSLIVGILLGFATAIAGLGIGSHLSGTDLLAPFFPEPTPLKGNAAIALGAVVAATALDGSRAARALGVLAAAIGAVTLLEYAAPVGSPIDELVFGEFSPGPEAGPYPGRLAVNTALAFVLLGTALALRSRWGIAPAILALTIGLIGVLGYTGADTESLSRVGKFVQIALPTAVAITLTAGALILRRERSWLMRRSVGGTVVRRVGPLIVVVPALSGSVWLAARNAGLVSEGVAIWLLTVGNLFVGSVSVFVISVALDRVERRNATALAAQAEELREALDEVRRSNQELEQFAYVASHDLSEPLRVVGGFVGLLQRRYSGRLDDDADTFIDAATSGVERMQAMIDALLQYSRVGSKEFEPRPVDCNVVVAQAVESLKELTEDRDATITVEPLPTVSGEPALLGQLFQNLISNAVKFTEERPPEVTVSAERDAGEWTFRVSDNGPGIEPRHADRVFEMFQRLHSRDTPGTGIGLAVCKRIAERHGGGIRVAPGPDGGSVFQVSVADSES